MTAYDEIAELQQTGIEVALSMLGTLSEVVGELAALAERDDLVLKVADMLDMTAEALEATNG